MNGFERHGIDHLSASSINLWRNAPDVWVARYLHGMRGTASAAMERGKAVEAAVVEYLYADKEGRADALAKATKQFDAAFSFEDVANIDRLHEERDLIAPMAEIAWEELMGYGAPDFDGVDPEPDGTYTYRQPKVTVPMHGKDWHVDIIGYLDFDYGGLIVDLKTTKRIPSVMSPEHQLQRAIYATARGNADVQFLYVSSKKASWLADGDPATIMANVVHEVTRLERFLRHNSKKRATKTVPVNPNSFYWRGDEALRAEIFGL